MPHCLMITKYFGFEQLKYLYDKHGIDCVIAEEVRADILEDINKKLKKYPDNSLLTVRTATFIGNDFGMPSNVKCSKADALDWIYKKFNENSNYAFFISSYVNSHICGRIHISLLDTRIDLTIGDFEEFSHGFIDISIKKEFNSFYNILKSSEEAIESNVINELVIDQVIRLSNNLLKIYKSDLESKFGLTYEFDFVIGEYENQLGICSDSFLKLISMRTYSL